MKIKEIIQPVLTVKEHELLSRVETIHQDPEIHTNPNMMRMIIRLMKMGLLRQNRSSSEIKYEITEKCKNLL
jgi:hypothetical protein